jgi:hypothetical protein
MISGNGKGSEFSTMRQLDRFVDGLPYPDCLPITAFRLVLRSLPHRLSTTTHKCSLSSDRHIGVQ